MHRWIIFGLLACGLAACSSDDDDPTPAATGGTAGSAGTGGSGGATGGTGGTGGAVVADCPGQTCAADAIVLDGTPFLEFPACCADEANDKCGLDVDSAKDLLGVSGCMEVARSGPLDAACPNETIDVVGTAVELPGCCQESGICGLAVDVGGLGQATGLDLTGPDFGCQDAEPFIEGYTATNCGT